MLGCVFANILLNKPLFVGKERSALLAAQFKVVGTVGPENFAEAKGFPLFREPAKKYKVGVDKALTHLLKARDGDHSLAIDLISKMLRLDPKERCSAAEAAKHDFFVKFQKDVQTDEFKSKYVEEWTSLQERTLSRTEGTARKTEDSAKRLNQQRQLFGTGDGDVDDLYDMEDLLGIDTGDKATKKPKLVE